MVFIGVDEYITTGNINQFKRIASRCLKIEVGGYVRIEFFDNLVVTIGVAFDCLTIKNVVESIFDSEIRIKKYYKNIDSKGFFKAVWELKQNYIKEVDNAKEVGVK